MPVALPVALPVLAAVVVLLTLLLVLFNEALAAVGPAWRTGREPFHPAEEAAVARARQQLRGHG